MLENFECVFSLQDSWHVANLLFVYRRIHNLCDNTLKDTGLALSYKNKRSGF